MSKPPTIEGHVFTDSIQFVPEELRILVQGRYVIDGAPASRPWTESVTLRFADAAEFKTFLRDLEKWGRARGWLPARKKGGKQL